MSKTWPHSDSRFQNNKNMDFSTVFTEGISANGQAASSYSIHQQDQNTFKRTVLVHISGNRATWEHMGIHGALWRVNPERVGIMFGGSNQNGATAGGSMCSVQGGGMMARDPQQQAIHDYIIQEKLSRAMIHKVTVLESNTNIDELIAVTIDGLPCSEFTNNGDCASLFMTGEGKNTESREIFNMTGNTELGLAWMKQYPKYTTYNLEEVGTMFLPGCSYYFVHVDHPVIHMLKTNEDTLGIHISEDSIVSDGWHKVDIEVFIYCIRSIRDNILQNAPSTFNLNQLTVRIGKPDGQRWLQLGPQLIDGLISDEVRESDDCEVIAEARKQAVQRYIDKPLFLTLRLCLEYSLPEMSASEISAANNHNNNNNNQMMNGGNTNNAMLAMMAASASAGGGNNSMNNNNNNCGNGSVSAASTSNVMLMMK